ncbi:AlpA family phage regulatory protein [Sphingomonas koreensis]|uniref:AlpA family phage regulatory protein n=1 Tax=Sphingomonas koreensis TaxID=93064 RepID=A0A430G657_9SPHN|nr:AlpA family phage regulatory protein [Sphingomonas koreensis]RSY88060.1 AlpA family phage regulatory protein [Sphingomonas koreensis]
MTANLNPTSGSRPVPLRFLRQPDVLARVGVTWITILRWEKQGLFPKRRKLGPNTVAWVEAEIDEWCAGRAVHKIGEVA